jgi:hypothetical protein
LLLGVRPELGSSRIILLVVLGLAILGVLALVGREIYRTLHPRSKPMRKRKRRTF